MNKQIQDIQAILDVEMDGVWGPKSQAALDALIHGQSDGWHKTTATSFADPEDVRKFKECKAQGHSDDYCFAYGDNGVGTPELGGHSTVAGSGASCALPSKYWRPFGSAAEKKKVIVEVGGKTATVELKDTSGSRDVIDLNPDACALLGLKPPVKEPAQWRWA